MEYITHHVTVTACFHRVRVHFSVSMHEFIIFSSIFCINSFAVT